MLHHVLLSVIITPAFAKLLRANRLPVVRYMARVRDADIMCAAHKNLHCGRDARFGCSSSLREIVRACRRIYCKIRNVTFRGCRSVTIDAPTTRRDATRRDALENASD